MPHEQGDANRSQEPNYGIYLSHSIYRLIFSIFCIPLNAAQIAEAAELPIYSKINGKVHQACQPFP